jgi:hypothetical protein
MVTNNNKIKVMDIEVRENQYETEQELLKLSALEDEVGVFDFEFKTRKEFYEKQRTTWEFQYKCIRVKTLHHDGYSVDFPIKTEEEYHKFLLNDDWQAKLKKIEAYKTDHWWFQKEYC